MYRFRACIRHKWNGEVDLMIAEFLCAARTSKDSFINPAPLSRTA